jgi:hypothetical protein
MYQFPVEAKSTTQRNPSQTMDRSQCTHKATTNRPCRRDQNPPGEQSINASDTGGGVPEEYNGLHHGHPWFFRIFSDKTHVRRRISAVPGDSMWGCGGGARIAKSSVPSNNRPRELPQALFWSAFDMAC